MADSLLLNTALGEPGSGRVRYGAAMALYRDGLLDADQLEAYRVASADDALDPRQILEARALSLPTPSVALPEHLIRSLVDESDVYISRLSGPGIAEVREGIARFRNAAFQPPLPRANAIVESYLQKALDVASVDQPALCALIAATCSLLRWITYDLYDRAKIGDGFAEGHAFCTIIGEDGPIHSKDFDLGLFLIAPHVLYRDHCHPAPELYAPLTGPHGWRFKPNAPMIIKNAHMPVWNEPNAPHMTKVGTVPFLCLYCWTRDNDKPAQVLPANDWAELEVLRLG